GGAGRDPRLRAHARLPALPDPRAPARSDPMTAPASPIQGLVPIVATPFDARGRLDEASLRGEIDYLIGAGVDGLTVFGVAGEFYAVGDAERIRGVRVAVEQARGRVPVVAGTGHTGTE